MGLRSNATKMRFQGIIKTEPNPGERGEPMTTGLFRSHGRLLALLLAALLAASLPAAFAEADDGEPLYVENE